MVPFQDNPHYPPTQDMIAGSQLSFSQIADDVGTDPEVALKLTSQNVEKDEEHTSVETQQHLVDVHPENASPIVREATHADLASEHTSAQVSQSVKIHAESTPAEIQATCLPTDRLRYVIPQCHIICRLSER